VTGLFLFFLALHTVHAVVSHRHPFILAKGGLNVINVTTQVPLFAVACYLGGQAGVFSRQLVSPVYLCAGLLAGRLIFCLSLLITHRSLRDALTHFLDFAALWNFTMESPLVLTRFVSVAFAEELVWRAMAQPLAVEWLQGTAAGILVVAIAFSLVHKHLFRNTIVVSAEFVGFAILLGVLYHVTGSLILVIGIHAVRDIEIAYLEYLIKVEELGDEKLATTYIERSLLQRTPENP
jgi:membrane protease YdiL (CAAX protease family)